MRKQYLDNLRWIAVLLLFPYHTFMIYNDFGESFYVHGGSLIWATKCIEITWPWIMPLLFTIAGMSSAYALNSRTTKEYVNERVHKLLIPLFFGLLLLVPVQSFIAGLFHNSVAQYTSFFTQLTDLTGYDGAFTPGHLWFMLYLFIISILALPLTVFYRKSKKKLPLERFILPFLLLLFLIPLVLQAVLDISGKSLGEYFAFLRWDTSFCPVRSCSKN